MGVSASEWARRTRSRKASGERGEQCVGGGVQKHQNVGLCRFMRAKVTAFYCFQQAQHGLLCPCLCSPQSPRWIRPTFRTRTTLHPHRHALTRLCRRTAARPPPPSQASHVCVAASRPQSHALAPSRISQASIHSIAARSTSAHPVPSNPVMALQSKGGACHPQAAEPAEAIRAWITASLLGLDLYHASLEARV